jgi:hypothetical protein
VDARAEVGADTGLAGEHGLEADERAHEAIDVAVIVVPSRPGADARLFVVLDRRLGALGPASRAVTGVRVSAATGTVGG